MVCDKVNIIANGKGSSPEKESINPPAEGISVLFFNKMFRYFNRHNLIHFNCPNPWGFGEFSII